MNWKEKKKDCIRYDNSLNGTQLALLGRITYFNQPTTKVKRNKTLSVHPKGFSVYVPLSLVIRDICDARFVQIFLQ